MSALCTDHKFPAQVAHTGSNAPTAPSINPTATPRELARSAEEDQDTLFLSLQLTSKGLCKREQSKTWGEYGWKRSYSTSSSPGVTHVVFLEGHAVGDLEFGIIGVVVACVDNPIPDDYMCCILIGLGAIHQLVIAALTRESRVATTIPPLSLDEAQSGL
ncbi:hypothetical protein H0H92_006096 [Tricholoma furcatifolium]|nr:hypothetical protein H0H92_006096 [Tricholoma furcatifolium]